jgi:cytochrome P450
LLYTLNLGALTEVMVVAIDECLEKWHKFTLENEPVDISQQFAHITMSMIVRTMFGTGISDEEFANIAQDFAFVVDYMLPQAITSSIPGWVPVPKRAQYQQALQNIDQFIYGLIEERRQTQVFDHAAARKRRSGVPEHSLFAAN